MRHASCENISVSLSSLARRVIAIYCQACESRNLWVSHLRDSPTSIVIIHSEKLVLDSKLSQDSLKTPELIVMILASLATKFVCETREKRFLLRNFVARLAFRYSRYEISVCEIHKKRVSLLILTRKSSKNLARILGLKSESRFSQECQKVILLSTLPGKPCLPIL